jgi:hypothetical protein
LDLSTGDNLEEIFDDLTSRFLKVLEREGRQVLINKEKIKRFT